MKELFRGYVETKDKKSVEKFKGRKDFKTFEQVKLLPEFAGVLADQTILIDVDDYEQSEMLMDIVEDLQLRCRVYETKRGKHFLFQNNGVNTCKTGTKVACGLTVDIKIGSKNSYEVLKHQGVERKIIYDIFDDEEYEKMPRWLLPIKSNVDFLNLEEGDGRNQTFFNYILSLQSYDLTKDEIRDTIRIINKYIVKEPLAENEIDVILRDDAFSKPVFFKDKVFLFDKLFLKICFFVDYESLLRNS